MIQEYNKSRRTYYMYCTSGNILYYYTSYNNICCQLNFKHSHHLLLDFNIKKSLPIKFCSVISAKINKKQIFFLQKHNTTEEESPREKHIMCFVCICYMFFRNIILGDIIDNWSLYEVVNY